jgi:hypothetical protein
VDGLTWKAYEAEFDSDKLEELHARLHRGAYRALPSRRVSAPQQLYELPPEYISVELHETWAVGQEAAFFRLLRPLVYSRQANRRRVFDDRSSIGRP